MSFTHLCSCGASYTDEDFDPYFCPTCVEQRKAVAKQIDAQFANKPKEEKPMTDLQIALEKGKTMPSASGGHSVFVKAADLGIMFD